MSASVMPTAKTRRLAARIVAAAVRQGADSAHMVSEVERGQEVALVGVLACLAAGENAPVPGRPRATTPVPRPKTHELIACRRCRAKIYEPCRTASGNSRLDHAERLFPRRCRCGGPIPKKRGRDWCDACRHARKQQADRDADRRRRARIKEATTS